MSRPPLLAPGATPVLNVNDLPGPPGLPVLGNLPEFLRGGEPHRVLQRWCDQYGPTFRVRLTSGTAVVTADPQILSTVLRERPDSFRRGAHGVRVVDEMGLHGVFTAEGQEWRRLRRIATQSLSAPYLREYFTTITRVTQRLQQHWAGSASTAVPVLDDLMRYTLDVTVALALGHDLNSLQQRGDGLHSRLPLVFPELGRRLRSPLPYWRYLRLPRDRRLDATMAELSDLVRERFAHAQTRAVTGAGPTNFLEALLAPMQDQPPVSEAEVVSNVLTMLLAGEETTAATAAWTLHFLAGDDQAQQRVRAEVDAVLGDRDLAALDHSSVRQLSFTAAVVDEAVRLRPVAPQVVVQPLEEVVLDGQDHRLRLSAGTPVFALLAYGARRASERFPDPDAFRPERWLTHQPTARPQSPLFLPFGSGPRFCPGRNLALLEATLVAAMACRDFDLVADTSQGPVTERVAFTVFPANLHLRFIPRAAGGS